MEAQENVYKVTIKRKMGVVRTESDKGLFESSTFYFRDIGDVTFSQRLVNYFEHGCGKFGEGFTIAHIENLGSISTTQVS